MAIISVEEYIENLSDDRKSAILKLRETINDNLPEGFKETISYGMPGYVVPHEIYPKGYHCDPKLPLPFLSYASQKSHIALYYMGIYMNDDVMKWFVDEYPKHSKYKLDMGKSCIRFKTPDRITYDLIGELLQKISMEEYIKQYELSLAR
jgi:uncharacterized protein YdhG (YjbR/CyaY superfamily)